MELCAACGLAQLADDDTVADEPRGVEPQALRDQAARRGRARRPRRAGCRATPCASSAARTAAPGCRCSPSAVPTVAAGPAPMWCSTASASCTSPTSERRFAQRAAGHRAGGVLLLQFHSLADDPRQGQWNALRHGHFAYYSLTALTRLLADVGMRVGDRLGVRPVRRHRPGGRAARPASARSPQSERRPATDEAAGRHRPAPSALQARPTGCRGAAGVAASANAPAA